MSTTPEFVTIPPELLPIVGEPDEGTRLFRREGSSEECAEWLKAIMHKLGPCVSPGGVSMYAPVSRAGVHKRLRSGKMTAFLFHMTRRETTFFGMDRKLKEQPYVYIPVSECEAWAEELKRRCDDRQAQLDAAGGEKPDWEGDFLESDPKDNRKRGVKYVTDLDRPITFSDVVQVWGAHLADKLKEKFLPPSRRRGRSVIWTREEVIEARKRLEAEEIKKQAKKGDA